MQHTRAHYLAAGKLPVVKAESVCSECGPICACQCCKPMCDHTSFSEKPRFWESLNLEIVQLDAQAFRANEWGTAVAQQAEQPCAVGGNILLDTL